MNHATALLPPDIQALRENLTDFQARFAEEYLVDLNASQAAVRAGSTATRPGQTGFDTLKLPEVAEYVGALQRLRSERTEIDADWVLRESTKLYQRCVNDKRVLTDRKGMPILDEDGQLQWVFNATGAAKALELVGKHVNIQAFKENVGLSGAIGVAVVDARALSDEQLRALAAIPIGPKAPGGD